MIEATLKMMRDAAYARHKMVFGDEHVDFVDAVYRPYFQAIAPSVIKRRVRAVEKALIHKQISLTSGAHSNEVFYCRGIKIGG